MDLGGRNKTTKERSGFLRETGISGGKKRMGGLTPEQRSGLARMAVAARITKAAQLTSDS